MARNCKDGYIKDDPQGSWGRFYGTYDGLVARSQDGSLPRSCYSFGMDTSLYEVLSRYDSAGGRTQLARLTTSIGVVCAYTLTAVGSAIEGKGSRTLSVTDATFADAGDWRVKPPVLEAEFMCYDAPAPSGPKHRVIGSGIVNSHAIVRGAA